MLTIRLLGQFEMRLDGKPLRLPTRAAESLAAWLILHSGPAHRRELLAGILWPDAQEGNARNNLRHALWRLRQAIPDGYLHTTQRTIGWRNDAPYTLDVNTLQAEAGKGSTIEKLAEAVAAYSGELLPGFYDEWVVREREGLTVLYEERMAHLLERLLTESHWQEAIDWAEKWIAQGHTPEPAYRALMQSHASLGNSAAALAVYRRCVDALESDLDVPPSPETTALADAIRTSQFSVHHSQFSSSQSSTPPITRSNLPAPTTPLIGRESELAALATLLADPSHRLVTILGPGGMGKSRLALAAAQTQTENFADGVFFVPLTAADGPDTIVTALAASLDRGFLDDRRPPKQQLFDYLRSRKVLLLLDNFEHLLQATPLLVELLQAAPDVKLLVTSPERLHLAAETLLRLDGLVVPEVSVESSAKEGYSAVDLFVQSARRLRHDFTPQTAWAEVTRICRMVGGMPLGIVLAASWVNVLTPGEIADEISQSLDFLAAELHDLNPLHRSLAAVFEQSWQRLTPSEQKALMSLSIFAGSFDRAAAKDIAGAPLPLLTRLMDRALLARVGEGRYDLHEVVRQLARQKLGDSGQEAMVRRVHSQWYLAFVARQTPRLKGAEQEQAVIGLEEERENVRAAWHWAAQNREIGLLQQAVEALGIFYNRPGQWAEGEALTDAAIRALSDSASAEASLLLVWLLTWQGIHLQQGQKGELAQARMTQALELTAHPALAGIDVRSVQALLSLFSNGVEAEYRRPGAFARSLRRAVELFEEVNDRWWLVRAQLELGNLEFWSGNTRQAKQRISASRQIAQQIDDHIGLAHALNVSSLMAECTGDFSAAQRFIEERRTLRIEQPLRFTIWDRTPWVAISQGQFQEALDGLTASLLDEQRLGVGPEHTQIGINGLARAHVHLGNFQQAYRLATSAADLWTQAYGEENLFILRTVGRALLGEGKHTEAQQLLSRLRAEHQKKGDDDLFSLGGAFIEEIYPFLLLGDLAQARHCLMEGMRVTSQTGAYRFTVQALPAAALLLALNERLEEAAYIHGLIQRYPYLTNSRFYAKIALDRLAELLASLPPDMRAAAEERGRARELPEMTAELLELLGE